MSKVVYILDKIVWMLLIAAVTTQALQMAGIVNSPKALGDISYKQDNEYNFNVAVGTVDGRGKRQTEERSKFIDNLFNVQRYPEKICSAHQKKEICPKLKYWCISCAVELLKYGYLCT